MPWAWIGLALAAALALGCTLVWRRRNPNDPPAVFAPPVVQRPMPETPLSTAITAQPLTVELVAARMSASLVNATLAYRLILIAGAGLEALVVRGDMISAHASRADDEQLEAGDAPVLHRAMQLAEGQTLELKGEIRLPLAAITPIRHGTAALFVPLARIEIDAVMAGKQFKHRAAFVIGLEDPASGTRLQPFRLDLGPRVYSKVGQRALPVPAFA